jgi:molybdopterin molybdotransferase
VSGGFGDTGDRIPVEEALGRILGACPVLPAERLSVDAALGRALAEEVRSRVDHPAWDNSAMDGFAVRAPDVAGASPDHPVSLPVSDEVPAGAFPSGPLVAGSAARVMTGAPVPDGATGVIRIEHTDGGADGRVEIRDDADAERNVRRRGEDMRSGSPLFVRGTEVTPAVLGALALAGVPDVAVGRRPRVGVLSSGDELADFDALDEVLAGRRILNSNAHALAAQLRDAGAEPVRLGIARDDEADVRRLLEAADDCDAVISTGGVSVGDHDVVKAALDAAGVHRLFWRVRLRPGSPTTFGVMGHRPFFGLPGNPVSAMVTFEMFVRPALRRMGGHALVRRATLRARAGEPISSPAALTHCFRVRLRPVPGDLPEATLTGAQGSGILTSMAFADGLAVVPEEIDAIEPGDLLDVIPLRGWTA